MIQFYLDVIDSGLSDYELNISSWRQGKCSFNMRQDCHEHIRVCYVDNKEELHTFCCDGQVDGTIVKPDLINAQCRTCELMRLCNGCHCIRTWIREYTSEHCNEMLKLKNRIIEHGL
jgi:hypothetical protein